MRRTFLTGVAITLLMVSLSACKSQTTGGNTPLSTTAESGTLAGQTIYAGGGSGSEIQFEKNGQATLMSTFGAHYGIWGVESDGRHWVQFQTSPIYSGKRYFEVKNGRAIFSD